LSARAGGELGEMESNAAASVWRASVCAVSEEMRGGVSLCFTVARTRTQDAHDGKQQKDQDEEVKNKAGEKEKTDEKNLPGMRWSELNEVIQHALMCTGMLPSHASC